MSSVSRNTPQFALFTPSKNKPYTELHGNDLQDSDSFIVKGEKCL